MVLDDASPQAGAPPSDFASDSDPSPNFSEQNSTSAAYSKLKINPELLVRPDPFTLYFGFFGSTNWQRNVLKALGYRVDKTREAIARYPTQEEMDAFTTHTSRSLYYSRTGVPIFFTASAAKVYMDLRKNPLSPRRATASELFRALRLQAVHDKSNFAKLLFSSAFKMLFWTTGGGILASIAGTWSEATGCFGDPRLRQLITEMKNARPEDVRKRQLEAANERVRRARSGQQVQQQPNWGGGGYDEGVQQDAYSYGDSASATSSYENDYSSASTTQQNDSTYQSRPGPDTSRRPPSGPAPQQSNAGSDFFDDDDASPTAPEYRGTNADGSPAGSAWERIRRESGVSGSK